VKVKQELWFTLIQKRNGSEVAKSQPFKANPETTIGDMGTVEDVLTRMGAPTVTFELKPEWRDAP
jgi:hypothetical protein